MMVAIIGEIPDQDVRAIEGLLHRSTWLPDHGQAALLPSTLAPDGRVYGMGPEPIDLEAFTQWADQRQANSARHTRHIVTNVQLESMADGRVRGTSSVMIWAVEASAHPELSFIGDFEDIYVKDQRGQWLMHERRLVPMVALG